MLKVIKGSFQKKKGFTLIEMIIVIAVMLILMAISVIAVNRYLDETNKSVDQANLRTLNEITELYAISQQASTSTVFSPSSSVTDKMNILINAGLLSSIFVPKQKDIVFLFNNEAGLWYLSNDNIIYTSSFDSSSGITSLINGWTIVNGKLTHTVKGESRAIFDSTNGSDYTISVSGVYLSGTSSQSGYGIYYRVTNSEKITGYCFQFDPGGGNVFTVRKVVNGTEKQAFQSVSMKSVMGSDFDIHASHDIQITVTVSQHTITVDGVTVLSFSDSSYAAGYVGVRTWNNTQVEIDDVTVTKKE
ncbi:MAG: type II secretion system protein [Erysipelotrichaceae bacterium]|nr:type II secretion system protein [Erysipelotrichaceae bacterium]